MKLKVLCLIPALDAADTVGGVIAGAKRRIPGVLVVDDGSTDGTADRARAAGAVVISHKKNIGKGAALRTGFVYALKNGFDAVLTIDADGQHDPDEIPGLLKAGEGEAGIVIGGRLGDKASIPPARYYANMVGVRCISWRARNRIEDSQWGFRLYKADVLRDMKYTSVGFETETELLIRAGMRGFRIANVPVRTIYSDDITRKSRFRAVADTYRICMLFLRSFFW
jgi:glycosyltransferase involved in cell wall biosynthesis